MAEIGIVLVDDHPIVLRGLVELFADEPGFAVLAACRTGAQARAAVERCRPQVLLLDVSLPDRDGIGLLPEFEASSPQMRTVIFAAALDEVRVAEARHRGAKAVLFKDTPPAQLVARIREVAAGLCEAAAEDEVSGKALALTAATAACLSPREREVAELAARGERNKEIAWHLGLAEGTVKLHISRAFKKLGVGNRVRLARVLAPRR